MFWRSKQPKKRPKGKCHGGHYFFKVERLEDRHMLSGVVNVVTTGTPGSLTFDGDSENDSIELQSDPSTPGQYIITGTGATPTLLTLNGSPVSTSTLTVNNITGTISVDLGDGNKTFDFEGPTGGGTSTAPSDVDITNSYGSDTNIFNNVVVDGNLNVTKAVGAVGSASLSLTNTTIEGDALVDNTGSTGGGDTTTTIASSILEGGGATHTALGLTTNDGNAILQVSGTTTFGAGFKGAAVDIENGDGGSVTTFAGTATLYGPLDIENGDAPLQGQINMVTFNGTTVLGTTTIDDGHATTKVTSTNSTLGSLLAASPQPVTITNGTGYDSLTVTGSTIPWGMGAANDGAILGGSASTGAWGSSTTVSTSSVGTRIGGPNLLVPALTGDAFALSGDNGPDVVAMTSNTIGGILNLGTLGAGNNSVTLDSNTIGAVDVATSGLGNNFVEIAGGVIQASLSVNFGGNGSNNFTLANGSSPINGSTAPVLPSLLNGSIHIDGGPGISVFHIAAGLTLPPFSNFASVLTP